MKKRLSFRKRAERGVWKGIVGEIEGETMLLYYNLKK